MVSSVGCGVMVPAVWLLLAQLLPQVLGQVGASWRLEQHQGELHEELQKELKEELHEDIKGEELERARRGFYTTGKHLGSVTSQTLDYLLYETGYNRRIRPNYNSDPVVINVNMEIKSMGPVDDMAEVYSLDCYFRQTWVDQRLSYNTSGLKTIALNWAFLAKIWVPDTFFVNGKKSFLHKITVPNRFVRIDPSGKISYSQRLTIQASCTMNLRKFPLDTQNCNLEIGSFAYTAKDVVYKWQANPYSIDKTVQLAQFGLMDHDCETKLGLSTRRDRGGFRNDSTVNLNFVFERQTGFFLLQIYTPLTLIVFCSWVSFWLVKTEKGGEVPARTALGATTVLSIVNLGFGGKAKPKVGYATALDVYIIICFFAVFAALVEFACINFIDTFIKRFKAWELEEKSRLEREAEEEQEEEKNDDLEELVVESKGSDYSGDLVVIHPPNGAPTVSYLNSDAMDIFFMDSRVVTPTGKSEVVSTVSTMDACVSTEDDEYRDVEEPEEEEEKKEQEGEQCCQSDIFTRLADWLFTMITRRIFRKYSPRIPQMTIYSDNLSVILGIDSAARKLFPLVFLGMQATYWASYLYWL